MSFNLTSRYDIQDQDFKSPILQKKKQDSGFRALITIVEVCKLVAHFLKTKTFLYAKDLRFTIKKKKRVTNALSSFSLVL